MQHTNKCTVLKYVLLTAKCFGRKSGNRTCFTVPTVCVRLREQPASESCTEVATDDRPEWHEVSSLVVAVMDYLNLQYDR